MDALEHYRRAEQILDSPQRGVNAMVACAHMLASIAATLGTMRSTDWSTDADTHNAWHEHLRRPDADDQVSPDRT